MHILNTETKWAEEVSGTPPFLKVSNEILLKSIHDKCCSLIKQINKDDIISHNSMTNK